MKKQVNQQSLLELRESLAEYANRTDHAGMLILAQIAEALTVKQAQDEKAKGPLWIRTHGAEFAVPVEVTTLVEAGVMFDVSYRNDSCPSFCNKNVDGDNYPEGVRVLWVDHPSAYSREVETMNRYGVTSMEDGHTILETLYDGDDINAALRVMFPPPTVPVLGAKFAEILQREHLTATSATPREWMGIEEELHTRGYKATVEGGGAACPFIDIELADGTVYLFGDVNETWSADHYVNREAQEQGTPSETGWIDTGVSTKVTDPQTIVDAFEAKLKALDTPKNVFDYACAKLPFAQVSQGFSEYPLDSVCGIACVQIIDKAVELLTICDTHTDVVKPISQGAVTACEVICFG